MSCRRCGCEAMKLRSWELPACLHDATAALLQMGTPGLQVIMEDFVQSQVNLEADLRYFQAGGQEGEATSAGTVTGASRLCL